jgi:hypothetical protein
MNIERCVRIDENRFDEIESFINRDNIREENASGAAAVCDFIWYTPREMLHSS